MKGPAFRDHCASLYAVAPSLGWLARVLLGCEYEQHPTSKHLHFAYTKIHIGVFVQCSSEMLTLQTHCKGEKTTIREFGSTLLQKQTVLFMLRVHGKLPTCLEQTDMAHLKKKRSCLWILLSRSDVLRCQYACRHRLHEHGSTLSRPAINYRSCVRCDTNNTNEIHRSISPFVSPNMNP